MPLPPQAAPSDTFWHRHLRDRDDEAHAAEAARATALELDGLRQRCAELAAALTQARAAITVRHELITEQTRALADQGRALEEARDEAARARATLDQVLGSRRWRYTGALAGLGRRPRAALARLRGRV